MILYYAVGGGLGHLTRARGVMHTLGIAGPVTIVTVDRFGGDRRVVGKHDVLTFPSELARQPAACRAWVSGVLEELAPEAVFIDTFPAGILGELCGLELSRAVPLYHIARLLRWDIYSGLLRSPSPRFEISYLAEGLIPEHEEYLRRHSRELRSFHLIDPPEKLSDDEARDIVAGLSPDGKPLWLVVHSGPADEIEELVRYARDMAAMEECDPAITVVSPLASMPVPVGLFSEVSHLDIYPAAPLFPFADRIISGCGFNLMRQAEPFRDRHRFIPFPRRYDDQFLRAARSRQDW